MELVKLSDYLWEIPKTGAMLVPGRVYASAKMIDDMREDPALTQVANVACLPGIVGYSLAMPDIHWGYGFPIGGVAAVDGDEGVISPGGVGYDINCGVRLARTHLPFSFVESRIDRLSRRALREDTGRNRLLGRYSGTFHRPTQGSGQRGRPMGAA